MGFPEYFQQNIIADDIRVIDNQNAFGMTCLARADLFIRRVFGKAARIAYGGDPDTGRLPEAALGAPIAAQSKNSSFKSIRVWAFDRLTRDEVFIGCRQRLCAARQGFVARWQRCRTLGKEQGVSP